MNVEIVNASQTLVLRHQILRPQQAPQECLYPFDEHPLSFHLGVVSEDQILGIASFYPTTPDDHLQQSLWRLRGMATSSKIRGQGWGKKLVLTGTQQIQKRGGTQLWCNARTVACGFYKKLGFVITSEEFDIQNIGPHFRMALEI